MYTRAYGNNKSVPFFVHHPVQLRPVGIRGSHAAGERRRLLGFPPAHGGPSGIDHGTHQGAVPGGSAEELAGALPCAAPIGRAAAYR